MKALSGKAFCRLLERHGWQLLRVGLLRRGGVFGAGLGDDLELYRVDPVDPSGGIENFDRDQAVVGVVIQDHPRSLLVADPGGTVAQHHRVSVALSQVIFMASLHTA